MNKTRVILLTSLLAVMAVALFAHSAQNLTLFDVSPNPMYKETIISVGFSDVTNINLVVETLGGELVANIYSGSVPKNASFLWERCDNSGVKVPAGTYFVTIHYGGRYTSTKKTLILK
ncbi:MAG TPA: hypothetical protein PL188_10380 [Candidatus Cloacimonadota bacterium]|nr:hypothetical protein [Candidatus Cloacimonadota bacterium]